MYIASVNDNPEELQERIKSGEEIAYWIIKKDDPNVFDHFCGTMEECQKYADEDEDVTAIELWQLDELLTVDYCHDRIILVEENE